MKDWPKYFLHYASKNGCAYWKFLSEKSDGKYFYYNTYDGRKGTQKSIYSLYGVRKEKFKQVSEDELTLLLLGGDNASS